LAGRGRNALGVAAGQRAVDAVDAGDATVTRAPVPAGAAVLLALAGCSTSPPPPPPPVLEPPLASVLVLPIADDTQRGPVRELQATIAAPLRGRGYGVVPVAAGVAWLHDAALFGTDPANPDLHAWARAQGIDAVLAIRVVRWDADWLRGLRRLDARILYRLYATDARGLVWERDSESGYEFDEWGSGFGFGYDHWHGWGSGFGIGFGHGWDPDPPYRSALEVCRRIQTNVAAYMPAGALARAR
jgi:hypothetical protein